MKNTMLIILTTFLLGSCVFAQDESKGRYKVMLPKGTNTTSAEWVSIVTDNTVQVSEAITQITYQTPEKEKNSLLKTALSKVQDMREALKPYSVIVESFSVEVGIPPSITINCKFKD